LKNNKASFGSFVFEMFKELIQNCFTSFLTLRWIQSLMHFDNEIDTFQASSILMGIDV